MLTRMISIVINIAILSINHPISRIISSLHLRFSEYVVTDRPETSDPAGALAYEASDT